MLQCGQCAHTRVGPRWRAQTECWQQRISAASTFCTFISQMSFYYQRINITYICFVNFFKWYIFGEILFTYIQFHDKNLLNSKSSSFPTIALQLQMKFVNVVWMVDPWWSTAVSNVHCSTGLESSWTWWTLSTGQHRSSLSPLRSQLGSTVSSTSSPAYKKILDEQKVNLKVI